MSAVQSLKQARHGSANPALAGLRNSTLKRTDRVCPADDDSYGCKLVYLSVARIQDRPHMRETGECTSPDFPQNF